MEPIPTVLVAECTRFAFPHPSRQVIFELPIGDGVHDQFGACHFDEVAVFVDEEQAKSTVDLVLAASEEVEHAPGVVFVARFSQDPAMAAGDGIAADDECRVGLVLGDVGGLLESQAGDEFRRRLFTAQSALG